MRCSINFDYVLAVYLSYRFFASYLKRNEQQN